MTGSPSDHALTRASDQGGKRQAIDVIADTVQFVGGAKGKGDAPVNAAPGQSPPPDQDDDIPF